MNTFLTQLKTLITSIVLKRNKSASVFETDIEYTKAADKYINTIDYGLNWDSYVMFDSDVLVDEAGLDVNLVSYYQADKENIPREVRTKLMEAQKRKIILSYRGATFEDKTTAPTWPGEKNDYYRMLAGQPPTTATVSDYVYAPANDYSVPTTMPVHLLTLQQISLLQVSGIMDTIIAANPTKGYLKFLGEKAIEVYDSRTAQNFEVLYINSTNLDDSLIRDFRIHYDKARTYYMVSFYNKEYANMFTWYDEFMGLCIMVMTVQRLFGSIYRQGLTRDFYDEDLIRYLFKSYSIPFIEGMDLKYQKALAKNLNLLLQYKATDKVLYDISYLLGFYNINIYKYYLIKRHLLDESGHPIFATKEQDNGNGTTSTVPDYEKMYNFHFQQVNLKETDVNTALTDDRNSIAYSTTTDDDPYWVNDDALKEKLYTTNFNNIITKYMSLDVAYKIVEMMYEVCHVLRMIIDNQEDYKNIKISIPKLLDSDINLFDLVIFLCALGAKHFGLDGTIPMPGEGYKVANVYGFNFKTDFKSIAEDIYDDTTGTYTKIDPALAEYIIGKINPTSMRTLKVEDIGIVYGNLRSFRQMVTYYLWKTKDKETYYQYRKLYKSLLITEDIAELYKDNNGTKQTTYAELLKINNPDLYDLYLNAIANPEAGADEFDVVGGSTNKTVNCIYYPLAETYINEIFVKINALSTEFKYLSAVSSTDSIFDYIMKLIRFFKSYTVDFVNSGIHYYFDDHYLMGLKLLDTVNISSMEIPLDDRVFMYGIPYKDYITLTSASFGTEESIGLYDDIGTEDLFYIDNTLKLKDDIVGTTYISTELQTDFNLYDYTSAYTQSKAKNINEVIVSGTYDATKALTIYAPYTNYLYFTKAATVADMYKLTELQIGNQVEVTGTNPEFFYQVIDTSKLTSASGYNLHMIAVKTTSLTSMYTTKRLSLRANPFAGHTVYVSALTDLTSTTTAGKAAIAALNTNYHYTLTALDGYRLASTSWKYDAVNNKWLEVMPGDLFKVGTASKYSMYAVVSDASRYYTTGYKKVFSFVDVDGMKGLYALTSSQISIGDYVKVNISSSYNIYRVKDSTNLNNEAGYTQIKDLSVYNTYASAPIATTLASMISTLSLQVKNGDFIKVGNDTDYTFTIYQVTDDTKLTSAAGYKEYAHFLPVNTLTDAYALTSAQVQNGDVIKITKLNTNYQVIDDTNLNNTKGYNLFYYTNENKNLINGTSLFNNDSAKLTESVLMTAVDMAYNFIDYIPFKDTLYRNSVFYVDMKLNIKDDPFISKEIYEANTINIHETIRITNEYPVIDNTYMNDKMKSVSTSLYVSGTLGLRDKLYTDNIICAFAFKDYMPITDNYFHISDEYPHEDTIVITDAMKPPSTDIDLLDSNALTDEWTDTTINGVTLTDNSKNLLTKETVTYTVTTEA